MIEEKTESVLRIDRTLQMLSKCIAPHRDGLDGVFISSRWQCAFVSNGSQMVVRPLGYSYSGPDVSMLIKGPMLKKNEWTDGVDVAQLMLSDDYKATRWPIKIKPNFLSLTEEQEKYEKEGMINGPVPVRVLPRGTVDTKEPIAVQVSIKTGNFPEVESLINDALSGATHHRIGIDLSLLRMVMNGLEETNVHILMPKDTLSPIIVQTPSSSDNIVLSAGMDKFGIVMPLRLD